VAISEIVPLALLVVAFAGVAALWAMSAEVAVLSFIALRPLVEVGVYVQLGTLTLGQVWGAGFLVLVVAFLVTEGRALGFSTESNARVPWILVVLLAAYALAAMTRGPSGLALLMWLRIAAWVLTLSVAECIGRSIRGQRRLMYAMGIFAALLVVVVVILIQTGRFGAAYYGRAAGSLQAFESSGQGPHGLAADAVLVLPMVLILVWEGRHRLGAIVVSGALCACVLLSFVRTAYVGLAAVLLVFVVVGVRARDRWVHFTALGLIVVAACSVYLLRSTISLRFDALLSAMTGGALDVRSTSGRLVFWEAILRYSTENPVHFLFGGGPMASYRVLVQRTGWAMWAHNDLLEMLATGGIMLAIVYVAVVTWMLVSTLRLCRDRRQSDAVRAYGLLATAAVASFVGMSLLSGLVFSVSTIPLAVLVGLARSMSRLPEHTALDVPQRDVAVEPPLLHSSRHPNTSGGFGR